MASPTRIRLVSPAVDFIDNHLSEYHQSLSSVEPSTHFDHALNCYVATPSERGMNLLHDVPLSSEPGSMVPVEGSGLVGQPHAQTFPLIMRMFMETYPDEPEGRVDKRCSIRNEASWVGVLHVLQSAGDNYQSESGLKGKLRKAGRFVGDKADVMKRVTVVIPEIDYSKPIAFKQTRKVREEVKTGLQNLMAKFGDIEDYLKLYSTRPKIQEAVGILYVSMLKGIEDVIGFYTRNVVIKGIDAVWSGEHYEQSLLDCLEKVNDNGKKLVDAAHYTQMEETHETFKGTKTLARRADSLKDSFNNMRDMLETYAKEHRQERDKERQEARQHREETQRLAYQIGTIAQSSQRQWLPFHLQAVALHNSPVKPIVSQEDLLEFLKTAHLDSNDMEYIMDYREGFLSRGQDWAGVIMPSPQFRDWLVNASSQELLIHGNSDPLPISPLTLFCALLVQNLRKMTKFWTVAFFCGCHPYEEYGGARTLITSLIAQLLRKRPFDLRFIQHDHVYQMDLGNVRTYCFVFGQLVRQIDPDDTVFCVIDGINFYEGRAELLEDTADTIRFLLDMTRGHTVFKILLSSPSNTEDVRKAIRDDDHLSLQRDIPKAHETGDLRFERQLNENLEA
ncbi:hypothetical protein PG991_010703 [Apiospora marii]|uniref:Nephrocystin 3-like N-terminal domain-containing protein n=1 Tax=Apiospora marii TaxID=335849 RepID=A0ABR1RC31_9PEZI